MRITRILVSIVAGALVVGSLIALPAVGHADPLTYELEARSGQGGTTPVGTITFADGASGDRYYISTPGTRFELGLEGAPPSWDSDDPGTSASGAVLFAVGVIGDELLKPAHSAIDLVPGWFFENAGGFPVELMLSANDGPVSWSWYDGQTTSDLSFDPDGWQLRLVAGPGSVPEPGSLALLGLGVLGLAWRRRRRRTHRV